MMVPGVGGAGYHHLGLHVHAVLPDAVTLLLLKHTAHWAAASQLLLLPVGYHHLCVHVHAVLPDAVPLLLLLHPAH